MRRMIASVVLMALSACSTTGDWGAGGSCREEPASRFVGQKATGELGWKIQAATGARTLRWVPPRSAVTMDFRPDRVTVGYDDDMTITSAKCG